LEHMRRRLALHPSFTLQSAFEHCDVHKKGYLSAAEVQRLWAKVGVSGSEGEVKRVVKLMDVDGDGRVSYSDVSRWQEHG
jgi:Ca2+-binding EF-hand superfamily protein